MTKGSLVRFLPSLLGDMVLSVASVENPTELPHYRDSLVVYEGVLGPIVPGMGAMLNQQALGSLCTVPIPKTPWALPGSKSNSVYHLV